MKEKSLLHLSILGVQAFHRQSWCQRQARFLAREIHNERVSFFENSQQECFLGHALKSKIGSKEPEIRQNLNYARGLFNSDRLCQIPWLIDISPSFPSDIVGK